MILHLPEHVALVSLSATVSNAEEFGDWLVTVRGDTAVVVDEHRPVPLWQHMMVGSRMYDMFGRVGGRRARGRPRPGPPDRRPGAPERRVGPRPAARPRRAATPGSGRRRASTVIDRLDRDGLLPAITFVFSRAGCDAAVGQCVRSGLRLTTADEVELIRATIDRRTAELPQGDLAVLGYWEWREALERGIAAHHAGLLPAFKETVEELFVRGLVRAVFATETLALGINMPARTVVLERLVKFNGESHAELTPGEYTQLTGRAGRRGIDVEGHAVVIWQPGVDPEQVAGLASTRTYPLRSSFRPGYNMAVNLVGRLGVEAARELLEQSFGQFQADRSVVGLARRIERNGETLAGYAASMRCHLGDFAEYAALRRRVSEREKALARQGIADSRDAAADRAAQAQARRRHRRAGRAAGGPGRRARPGARGRRRPAPAGAHRRPLGRAAVHRRLPRCPSRRWAGCGCPSASTTGCPACAATSRPRCANTGIVAPAPAGAARAADRPPRTPSWPRCGGRCAPTPATAAPTARRTPGGPSGTTGWSARPSSCGRRSAPPPTRWPARSTASAPSSASAATSTARTVTADGAAAGPALGRVRPARRRMPAPRGVGRARRPPSWPPCVGAGLRVAPGRRARAAGARGRRVRGARPPRSACGRELEADERRHRVERTREPDLGFAWPMHRWARGESLAAVLTAAEQNGAELSAGDFVRWCRQVVDLLDQVADVAGRADGVGRAAADAVTAIRRGVVAVGTA